MANLMATLGLVAALTPLMDPTTPLSGMAAGAQAPQIASELPRLQSIVLGNGPALAVLGGQGYHRGELVAGWQISAIGRDRVELEKGQEKTTLVLFADKIIR